MTERHEKIAQLSDRIIRSTGNRLFLDEIRQAYQECSSLQDRLIDRGQIAPVEGDLRRQEADFFARIENECGRLSAEFTRTKIMASDRVAMGVSNYEETLREFYKQDREFSRAIPGAAAPQESPTDVEQRIERSAEAVKAILENFYKEKLVSISVYIGSLQATGRQYRRARLLYFLKRQGQWLFWSLVIFTIVIGAVADLVPTWYLGLLVLPVILWALEQFVLEPWLENRMLDYRRKCLRALIDQFFSNRCLLSCHLALAQRCLLEAAGSQSEAEGGPRPAG